MTTPRYMVTALVGGHDGTPFDDVIFMQNSNGNFIIDDSNKNQIDPKKPINTIEVYSGWVVDGISVTYNTMGGGTTTLKHGSGPASGRTTSKVTLSGDELLVGVLGLAGPQSYYKRDLVNKLSFVICNVSKQSVRVEGPFGNGNNSNEGTPFYCSDVLAFGGCAQDASQLGLSGLCFSQNACPK